MQRKFNGIWIPKELWFNKTLTLIEKIFLCEIDSISIKAVCRHNNAYFSNFSGLSVSRVSEIINSLKTKKFISTKMNYNRSSGAIESRDIKILTKGYDLLGVKPEYNTEKVSNEDKDKYEKFLFTINTITSKKFRGDKKSKRQFTSRLKEGYTLKDFKTAIANCFDDDFHKKNTKYLTPEFITREDKLQKYLNVVQVKQTTIVGESKRVKLFSNER